MFNCVGGRKNELDGTIQIGKGKTTEGTISV